MLLVPPIGFIKTSAPPIPFAGVGEFSTIYRPETAEQWTLVADGIVAPDFLFLCQETSGSLNCELTDITLAPANGPAYSQSVEDWHTDWLATEDNTNQGWSTTSFSFFSTSESIFGIAYVKIIESASSRFIVPYGSTLAIATNNNNVFRINTPTSAVAIGEAVEDVPEPVVLVCDRRGDGLIRGVTRYASADGTYGTTNNSARGLGSNGWLEAATAMYNYWAVWSGENAETMIDRGGAGLGGATLITELGWTA